MLAATLGLIAVFFLPLTSGGYSSGAAFQVGFVLLPLAAAIAWATVSPRPRLALLTVLLMALSLFTLPLMIQPGRELWFYLVVLLCAWVVAYCMLSAVPERARLLLPVITIAAVLTALYGWFLWLGYGQLHYQIISTFGLHNAYGGYLLLAWPAAVLTAVHEEVPWRSWLYSAAALFLVATLILTYSRATWVTLALQVLILGAWLLCRWVKRRRETRQLVFYAGGAIFLLIAASLAFPPVRAVLSQITDFGGYSMQGRLRFWQAALEIFRDYPLMGVGPGNYAFVYPQYQLDWMYYSVDPHSWPLQLLAELGVVGLCIALVILAGVAWWLFRLWRSTGGFVAPLLTVAVLGSLAHASVDFDYTFGATTALLGTLLAYGTFRASATGEQPVKTFPAPWSGLIVVVTVILLLGCALVGEALTLERYVLDRLRDAPVATVEAKISLIEQAVKFNPANFRTRYQLASLLAQPLATQDRLRALEELDRCLKLNPRYATGWALKGLLASTPDEGEQYFEKALALDPYNYPEHYFYYANLAQDDETTRERLLLGLERIPAHHPITPEHIRPTWYELNPVFAEWYYELARLTTDETEKEFYLKRGAAFEAYWQAQQMPHMVYGLDE